VLIVPAIKKRINHLLVLSFVMKVIFLQTWIPMIIKKIKNVILIPAMSIAGKARKKANIINHHWMTPGNAVLSSLHAELSEELTVEMLRYSAIILTNLSLLRYANIHFVKDSYRI